MIIQNIPGRGIEWGHMEGKHREIKQLSQLVALGTNVAQDGISYPRKGS